MLILNKQLFDTFFSQSSGEFFTRLYNFLESEESGAFTIWKCEGNLCEAVSGRHSRSSATFDIFDLGYEGGAVSENSKTVEFFDEIINIESSFFLESRGNVMACITFHEEAGSDALTMLEPFSQYLGSRLDELRARDGSLNTYVNYQKKIDFVKKGSMIFKAIELEEVLAVSLTFFMEVFSAEAACAIHKDNFNAIGLEEISIRGLIRINGTPLYDYVMENRRTEFIEYGIDAGEFNVKNLFVVFEPAQDIVILLFNIQFDIVPDKEFSDIVSSIVSIAVENALNHETMTRLKMEEMEMRTTGDILNKFVQRDVRVYGDVDIQGISYPARTAGGDFFYISDVDGKTFFCVADVCGKGYSAAVFTVVLSVYVSLCSAFEGHEKVLEKLVESLNRFLIGKSFGDRFITAFFALYDPKHRTLDYISCGHEPAVLFAEEKQELSSGFLPLGIIEDDYKQIAVEIPAGASLFIYTDGVIEYTPHERLVPEVEKLVKDGCKDIVNNLYNELVTDKDSQKDDFTCMFVRFR
ncbi:MAG: PP2C family protein-serine/threonine phosphatase [Deferribacterales bacterium]